MILAIDTSTLQASVALVGDDGALLATRHSKVTTHSEQLLSLVDEVLRERGAQLAALSAIACGAGPGSFTGLRIGLATAKGLCFATGRPLLLVSSLAALALRAPRPAGTETRAVVAAIDAFKGEVYAGIYRREIDDALTALAPETVLAPAALAEQLADLARDGGVSLIGDVIRPWPNLAVPGVAVEDQRPPDAAEVGRLAAARHRRGEADDLATAIPTYIRASEAEIKKAAAPFPT